MKVGLTVSRKEAGNKYIRLCQAMLRAWKEYLVNKRQREGVGTLF